MDELEYKYLLEGFDDGFISCPMCMRLCLHGDMMCKCGYEFWWEDNDFDSNNDGIGDSHEDLDFFM